jgi:hypothetical protein
MPSMPREVFAGSCAGMRPDIEPVTVVNNWQISRWLFGAPLLLSDNIVVKARKTRRG